MSRYDLGMNLSVFASTVSLDRVASVLAIEEAKIVRKGAATQKGFRHRRDIWTVNSPVPKSESTIEEHWDWFGPIVGRISADLRDISTHDEVIMTCVVEAYLTFPPLEIPFD